MIEMRNIHCSGNSRFITISGNMVACRATLLEVLEQSEQDTHNHFCFGSLLQVTSEERRAASPAPSSTTMFRHTQACKRRLHRKIHPFWL